MKRTLFFVCTNCKEEIKYDHKVKTLSKTHNKGEIYIDDDVKFVGHNCDENDKNVRGIAYLKKVEEIDEAGDIQTPWSEKSDIVKID